MALFLQFLTIIVISSAVLCGGIWLYFLVNLLYIRLKYNKNVPLETRTTKIQELLSEPKGEIVNSISKNLSRCMLVAFFCILLLWFFSNPNEQALVVDNLQIQIHLCIVIYIFTLFLYFTLLLMVPSKSKVSTLFTSVRKLNGSILFIGLLFCVLNWILVYSPYVRG